MKKILYALMLLTVSAVSVEAQSHNIGIQNVSIEKKKDSISVSFKVVSTHFYSNYKTILTPILYDGKGNRELLAPITLTGRKRKIVDERMGEAAENTIRMKKNEPVFYTCTLPEKEWMTFVSLSVERITERCCSLYEHVIEPVAENILLKFQFMPVPDIKLYPYELTELEKYDLNNAFLHPMEEYNKRYDFFRQERATGTSSFLFAAGSYKIDMNFDKNREIAGSIKKAFELIKNDPDAILKKIVIAGYASPEGLLANNIRLSQHRLQAVKSYIQYILSEQDDDLFEVYNGGEDWDGLKILVKNSTMPEKEIVLNIINSYTIEQEIRKTKLKQLNGGTPYQYMLTHLYPALRSAGYVQIYYDTQRSVNDAKAIRDENGRVVWINPESPQNRKITSINNSVELMVNKQYTEALSLLQEFSTDSRTWNNIGICYMMTSDYKLAELFFEQALQNGSKNAEKNLEQLKWFMNAK